MKKLYRILVFITVFIASSYIILQAQEFATFPDELSGTYYLDDTKQKIGVAKENIFYMTNGKMLTVARIRKYKEAELVYSYIIEFREHAYWVVVTVGSDYATAVFIYEKDPVVLTPIKNYKVYIIKED